MSTTPHEARRRAREVALQALFAMDLQTRRAKQPAARDEQREETHPDAPPPPEPPPPAEAEAVFAEIAANFEMPHAAHEFAHQLMCEVNANLAALDEIVARHARNWRVERMAVVDRNILRLASWELLHSDTPAPVVLDEAVELARRFGADTSPSFVNGVLDAIAKSEATDPREAEA